MSTPTPTRRSLLALPSPVGLALGSLAFMASLTPSLIPRAGLLQGAVAGLAFATFYGVAIAAQSLWHWLGLPGPSMRARIPANRALVAISMLLIAWGLAKATAWQNSIHDAMQLPPVESARPLTIAAVALVVALIMLLLGRLFHRITVLGARLLGRYLPRRVALLGGFAVAIAVAWSLGSGVMATAALHVLDSSYRQIDLHIPPDFAAPTEPEKTGSSSSLVAWETLGAQGRNRILAAPGQTEIADITQTAAQEPVRVYVGLNSADSVQERAELAVAELNRVGAFDRSVLVIATPTGTGWIDNAAMAPLEMLHRGDIASVSVQYSYLPSWLTLLVDPGYGAETARAVFQAVYGHWRSLSPDKRPRLYLFGLSLGSLNSDLSSDFFDIIGDPYAGALWVGAPFPSRTWRMVTDARAEGSPAWLPEFRDGSLFRFASQFQSASAKGAAWGPVRIVYLQYASDPITFFETASLWRAPAWMEEPRGPDVSGELRWIPIVTFLQLICDVLTSTTTPKGVGHVYDADHYLDGWIAVTAPQRWTELELNRLRQWLNDQGL